MRGAALSDEAPQSPSGTPDAPAPAAPPTGAYPAFPLSERIFLVLAGIFLASMVCMNVLGITRFAEIGGWAVPVPFLDQEITVFHLAIGVLPYPVTFLATDIVCELYGKRRASALVWTGFGLNIFLLGVCFLARHFDAPFEATAINDFYRRAWTEMGGVGEPSRLPAAGLYYDAGIYDLMVGATVASMVAYLAAQLCDVHLFHFWKRVTKGRHLWLRNNASTLVSQMLDTVCVLTITFWDELTSWDKVVWLTGIILGSYAFKMMAAFFDTPLFYLAVRVLQPYVQGKPAAPPDA